MIDDISCFAGQVCDLVLFSDLFQDASGTYYPSEKPHPQTFSYLIVDPLKRQVSVLYHRFGSISFDQ